MHNITLEILERTAALAIGDATDAIIKAKAAKQNAQDRTSEAEFLTRRARVALGVWHEALNDSNKTIHV